MLSSRIAVTLASCLAIAAFACSSAPAPTPGQGDRDTDTSPTTPEKPKGGSTNPGTPDKDETPTTPGGETTPSGDGAACLNKADADGCFSCCDALDPKAFDAANAAADACLCGNTGACKTQCANTACKGSEPDQACDTCIQSAPAAKCEDTFFETCEKDASCAKILACGDKCAEKFPENRRGGGGRGGGG